MDAPADDRPTSGPGSRFVGRRDVTHWRSRPGRRLAAVHHRLARRTGTRRTTVTTLAVGAGAALAFTWATTFLYDAVTGRTGIARIDVPVLHAAMRLRSPAVDAAAAGLAYAFGPVGMPLLSLAAASGLALRARSTGPIALVVAAGTGSLLMTIGGKSVVRRHRPARRDALPPFEHSPSFPSGHTMNATTIAGTVAYLLMLDQRSDAAQAGTAVLSGGLAATVGLSRVLLGAHWFTDVLTGWAAGSGWLSIVITSHRLALTTRDAG